MKRRDLLKIAAAAVVAPKPALAGPARGESCSSCYRYRRVSITGSASMCVGATPPIYQASNNTYVGRETRTAPANWCEDYARKGA